ncbi:MAG TPA: ATP synthase subunit I [Acidimicrobiales bacterium]|nr:ATP synthase subunit I [Acidimicrobiales bacterium]
MLADFPVMYVDLIVRRTIVSSAAVGLVGVVATALLGQPLAGVGAVLGLAGAVANQRLFQLSTARYTDAEGHLDRKPYGGSVALRLGALTAIVFALLFVLRPMGFGMIAGLVVFQLLLMGSALGTIWRLQRMQLAGQVPMTAPGQGAGPGVTEGAK